MFFDVIIYTEHENWNDDLIQAGRKFVVLAVVAVLFIMPPDKLV